MKRPMPRGFRPVLAAAALALAGACAPQVQTAGPLVAAPELQRDHVRTADDVVLPLRAWLPNGRIRAVVIGVHGLNDYGNSFAMPAETWRKAGIATYAYDQRGFGDTPQRGLWPGTERLVADFIAVARLMRARHPGVPLYASGTSMGGGVVLAAMARPEAPPLDGIILEAPAVWSRSTMPAVFAPGMWVLAHTVPAYRWHLGEIQKKLTDNPAVVQGLARDPKVLQDLRFDALYGLFDLMDTAYAAAAQVRVPVLLLHGDHDEFIPRGPILDVARALPSHLKRFAVYERGWHILYRDLEAEIVHRDVAAWIANRNAPLPSGADRSKAAREIAGRVAAGR
jgi:alpha-beta hydrolase superfamily lysophospholipase